MTATRRGDLLLTVAIGLTVLAGMVTMSEVFVDGGWIRPTVVTVLASLLVAAAARPLPAPLALLISIVAALVVAAQLHLPDAGLVPGADEIRALRELAETGIISIRDEAAPTQSLPELVFLVSTGAWFVTFSAHELAVRLRGAGVALVPVAALWVVPLAMPQSTPPSNGLAVPFLVASALVLLLEADTDLVGWAHDRIAPRVTVAGGTIAVGAIALGLIAPWLLPGLGEPPVLDLGTGRDPRGYQPIVDIGDRLALPVDRPVLRIRTDRRVYLRLAALETYDDNTWRVGPAGAESFTPAEAELFSTREQLPFETAIANPVTTVVDVEVLDLENIYVPTPYQPVEVTGPGADEMVWSRVGGFLATGELSENELGGTLRTGVVPGFRYQVTAAVPDPSIEQLRAAEPSGPELAPLLQLPGDPGRWRPYADAAEEVYAAAGARTTVDKVLALQDWFTGGDRFRYSLTDIDPLRGSSALENFLFDTRTGYCEYFSTAMAVMLRASGIPARTAVGFLPGERLAEGDPVDGDTRDTYEVTTSDAHAWIEVLFPGQGWVTFDPTPRSDGATIPPDADDLSPEVPVAERTEGPSDTADAGDAETPTTPDLPNDPGFGGDTVAPGLIPGETGPGGGSDVPPWAIALAAVALAVVIGLVTVRHARRREDRGIDEPVVALRRVLRVGEAVGVGRHESETATEVLHRWASDGRVDPTTAARLAALAQRAAFGPAGGAIESAAARAAADRLVGELRSSVGTSTRVLAPLRVPATRTASRMRRLVDAGRERLSP